MSDGKGKVPEGWEEVKLGEICTLNPSESIDEYGGTFLKMEDVSEDGEIQSTSFIEADKISTGFSKFRNDDILVAKITPCFENRKGALVKGISKVGLGSTEFFVLRAGKQVTPEYLFLLTRRESFFIYGEMNMQGSGGQRRVPSAFIKSLSLLLPPLPEQRKIAAILSTWDDSLSTLARLLDAKRQQKRGLAEALLTGQKRLPGFAGEWTAGSIRDVASEFSERGKNSELTVLSCTKHQGLVKSLEYFGKQVFSQDISNYKLVKRNMIAYATNHIEEGSIGIQNLEDLAVISPMYTVMEPNQHTHPLFLFMLLKTEYYRQMFAARMSASVDRRGSLRWNEFSKIPLLIPPLPEQKAIASVLSTLDAEIASLEALRSKVQEQKRGLMDELLTGRVRVRVQE